MPDNYEVFIAHEDQIEKECNYVPRCECCGEPIWDDTLIDIEGTVYHKGCFLAIFEQFTMDYIE